MPSTAIVNFSWAKFCSTAQLLLQEIKLTINHFVKDSNSPMNVAFVNQTSSASTATMIEKAINDPDITLETFKKNKKIKVFISLVIFLVRNGIASLT